MQQSRVPQARRRSLTKKLKNNHEVTWNDSLGVRKVGSCRIWCGGGIREDIRVLLVPPYISYRGGVGLGLYHSHSDCRLAANQAHWGGAKPGAGPPPIPVSKF